MLAGGDLGVASTKGGRLVLGRRFWGWRAPGEAVWCSRGHRLGRRFGVGIGQRRNCLEFWRCCGVVDVDAGCTRGHLSVLNVCCFWYTDSFLYLVRIKIRTNVGQRQKDVLFL